MGARRGDPRELLDEIHKLEVLADLAWGPMDAKDAAAFLKVSAAQFNRLAPAIPRCKKKGLGYRYLRSDVLAWLRSGSNAAELEAGREELRLRDERYPGPNTTAGRGKTKRLV